MEQVRFDCDAAVASISRALEASRATAVSGQTGVEETLYWEEEDEP